jgi:hypothetical protein
VNNSRHARRALESPNHRSQFDLAPVPAAVRRMGLVDGSRPGSTGRVGEANGKRAVDEGRGTQESERSDAAPLDTPYRAPRRALPPEL